MSSNIKYLIKYGLIASAGLFISCPDLWSRGIYLFTGEKNRESIFGKITDDSGKPIHARIEVWYPEIGLVTEENGQPVPKRDQAQRQLFHADHANEYGWYSVEVFPGDWLVRISCGPEYSPCEFQVHVDERELDGQRHDISLKHLHDMNARGWYSIDAHHHSLYSDGRDTAEKIKEAAKSVGLDAVALTDHNTVDHIPEWSEYSDSNFLAVIGIEVTTTSDVPHPRKGYGHHNAIGVDSLVGATDPHNPNIFRRYVFDSAKDVQEAIDAAHEAGGLYMINHAMQGRYNHGGTFSCWGEVEGYDAIEIHNGGLGTGPFTPFILGEDPARVSYWNVNTVNAQVWFEFLNAGNKVSGWGSSDAHDVLGLVSTKGLHRYAQHTGTARTYTHSGELTWPAMKKSLKKGSSFISSGDYGLLLLVESDGFGPGDEIRIGSDGKVPLDIEVLANQPLEAYPDGIRIIQGGRLLKTIPTVDGELSMKISTSVEVPTEKDTWLIVQAFGKWPGMAMTNAFYLDVPPYGPWGSEEWTFPENAHTWNNPWPVVPEITVPDGPLKAPHPQKESAFGYQRPMTREIAEKLLKEQYQINGIEADYRDNPALEILP